MLFEAMDSCDSTYMLNVAKFNVNPKLGFCASLLNSQDSHLRHL